MSYRKLGYGIISPILQPRVTEKLRNKVNSIYAGGNQFVNGVYPDEWHYRPSYSLPHTTREIVNGWKSCPLIASLVLSQDIAEGIQEITGWTSVRVGQDDVIWKPSASVVQADPDYRSPPPNGGPPSAALNTTVGYHQDSAYISTNFVPYEASSVTLWMALDDSDAGNGGLSYAEGSHKWAVELDEEGARVKKGGLTFMGEDGESYASPLIAAGRDNGVSDVVRTVVTPSVKSGGGLLHHQDTWHGSGVNRSEGRCRRAIAVHYVNGDCRFRGGGGAPWGECDYIYGRYRIRGSDKLEGSFFPVVAGEGREEWIDDWVEVEGVGEGFKEQVRGNQGIWGKR
ncbi:hypothetical protein TrRE_jg11672 [Triparma retinervis]|uniref:Phytanoyl-CoA dioxygenase n=1 Tax=Triparma retinervis TaxID=2557542 RepID=A0A9W7L218_9STRA|nr:hypothetical protein TrRE_jg11672 [Triparma retinervis]